MFIPIDILLNNGAIAKNYEKNEIIFEEGEQALFYYQVIEGQVKMYNLNEEGKEFTQGFFNDGESFGEPPLFINEDYPASAMTCTDSRIIKFSKDKFFAFLDENPKIQKKFLTLLATRIFNKARSSKDIINQKPDYRIIAFLEAHKDNCCEERKLVPFTRQEIANFTGLRVETVIRELSKLKKQKIVEIRNHKLYF